MPCYCDSTYAIVILWYVSSLSVKAEAYTSLSCLLRPHRYAHKHSFYILVYYPYEKSFFAFLYIYWLHCTLVQLQVTFSRQLSLHLPLSFPHWLFKHFLLILFSCFRQHLGGNIYLCLMSFHCNFYNVADIPALVQRIHKLCVEGVGCVGVAGSMVVFYHTISTILFSIVFINIYLSFYSYLSTHLSISLYIYLSIYLFI